MNQIDLAWREANTKLLPPLCLAASKDCADSQQTAVELAAKRQHYASTTATWSSVKPLRAVGDVMIVRAVGKALKVNIVDADGHVVSTDPTLDLRLQYHVQWNGDSWRIKAGLKEA